MTTFAADLASRLTSHASYWEAYDKLQTSGAFSTLSSRVEKTHSNVAVDDIARLLYCASVFAQTDNDSHKAMAQAIALNALLLGGEGEVNERSARVLVEVGNFPGLAYAREHFAVTRKTLLGRIQQSVSAELNSLLVGDRRLHLTDYQKEVWDALPNAKALAVSAPTSAGKSFLVIEHMCRMAAAASTFSAVYIAPTRALLSEVYQIVRNRLAGVEGLRVASVPSLDPANSPRQIFVLTQERLQVLLSTSDIKFDMAIADEAQNLSDGQRGMILQECIEELVRRHPPIRVVMLAPGADGFAEAAAVMGLDNVVPASTDVSPVLQNRILVNKVSGKNQLRLTLLSQRGGHPLGVLTTDRGLDLPSARLASVALELGSGGSLVYATGPKDAEDVAYLLSQEADRKSDAELESLAVFIEQHIHKDYGLASLVRRGVAFHYGKMPTLLRETLEIGFRTGAIKFLACTTTLFQGVNLPARNVFIDTPTRGRGTALDPPLLWNFAGRAGRMGKDIVGNVFLVDYDEWPQKPLDQFARFRITPAFNKTVKECYSEVLDAVAGNMPRPSRLDDKPARIRASAGLLIARAAKGGSKEFLKRTLADLPANKTAALEAAAKTAVSSLELPSSVLMANWTIDPYGQKRLYDRIVEKIHLNEMDELIPLNPHDTGASTLYGGIFSRILKAIYLQQGNFGGYVSSLAIPWMRGVPYPVILGKEIGKAKKRVEKKAAQVAEAKRIDPASRLRKPRPVDINTVIRKAFELIEDVVRFQFVQLGRAYIDLLTVALRNEGHQSMIPSIFDFSLALELGIATTSGRSFVELGLSRIAASALEPLYPNSNLTVEQARGWLMTADLRTLRVNQIILDEIVRLGLRTAAA